MLSVSRFATFCCTDQSHGSAPVLACVCCASSTHEDVAVAQRADRLDRIRIRLLLSAVIKLDVTVCLLLALSDGKLCEERLDQLGILGAARAKGWVQAGAGARSAQAHETSTTSTDGVAY